MNKKLASQQGSILDELSATEPIGEYIFWTTADTANFSQANLAKAEILSNVEDLQNKLKPCLQFLVEDWEGGQKNENIEYKPLFTKPLVGTDVETTGLQYWLREVIGWGFAIPKSYGAYLLAEKYLLKGETENVDFNDYFYYFFVHTHHEEQEEMFWYLSEIISEFNPHIKWCLHNAKFDQHWFKSRLGVYLEDIEDSICQAYLLGERSLAIDMLAPKYLSRFPTVLSKLTGLEKSALRNANPEVFLKIPIQDLGDYCAEDCIEGLLLNVLFTQKLKSEYTTFEQDNFIPHTLWDVYETCDRKSINALCWVEETGVLIEWDKLAEVRAELDIELESIELETAIHADLTTEESKKVCSSAKQLSDLLYSKLKLPTSGKPGKGGFYSTAEKELARLKDLHPVPALILKYREYAKLQSTYVMGLWKRQRNGKVHTTFNNCQTATGRYSSSDPNLQNIPNPNKTQIGKLIRQLFIAEEGFTLVKADYSQFELRILAHLSQDPYLIESYYKGLDIHSAVTCLLFGIRYEDFKPDTDKEHKKNRTLVKNINFGLIYGMSPQKLYTMSKSAGMNYTLKDCESIMNKYWSNLVGVTAWMAKTKLQAVRDGYTETVLGRRRYFEFVHPYLRALKGTDIDLTLDNWLVLKEKGVLTEHKDQETFRQCGNAPIQGTNGDAMRICMAECFAEWYGTDTAAILTVHDEIVLKTRLGTHTQVAQRLKKIMEGAIKLSVPVIVDPTIALNWGDC